MPWITIGPIQFPTRLDAVLYCRDILYGGAPGTELSEEEAAFVEHLLRVRPEKLAEIGDRKIVRYLRDWQPREHADREWTICLYVELDDGTRIDLSYIKAIDLYIELQKPAA